MGVCESETTLVQAAQRVGTQGLRYGGPLRIAHAQESNATYLQEYSKYCSIAPRASCAAPWLPYCRVLQGRGSEIDNASSPSNIEGG